jgi:hypothetical protein
LLDTARRLARSTPHAEQVGINIEAQRPQQCDMSSSCRKGIGVGMGFSSETHDRAVTSFGNVVLGQRTPGRSITDFPEIDGTKADLVHGVIPADQHRLVAAGLSAWHEGPGGAEDPSS